MLVDRQPHEPPWVLLGPLGQQRGLAVPDGSHRGNHGHTAGGCQATEEVGPGDHPLASKRRVQLGFKDRKGQPQPSPPGRADQRGGLPRNPLITPPHHLWSQVARANLVRDQCCSGTPPSGTSLHPTPCSLPGMQSAERPPLMGVLRGRRHSDRRSRWSVGDASCEFDGCDPPSAVAARPPIWTAPLPNRSSPWP